MRATLVYPRADSPFGIVNALSAGRRAPRMGASGLLAACAAGLKATLCVGVLWLTACGGGGGGSGQLQAAMSQMVKVAQAQGFRVAFLEGTGQGLSNTDYYAVEDTVRDWRVRNNVTDQPVTENVTATTRCLRYATPADAARPSARVTLCRVDPPDVYDAANSIVYGGGHSWPGGVRSPSANSDVPLADFDASAYLWRFLNP